MARRLWEFIRDRVEPAEVYRLGKPDLDFGELLPEKPGWLEQQEYEERTPAWDSIWNG